MYIYSNIKCVCIYIYLPVALSKMQKCALFMCKNMQPTFFVFKKVNKYTYISVWLNH